MPGKCHPRERTGLGAASGICTVNRTWDVLAPHLPFLSYFSISSEFWGSKVQLENWKDATKITLATNQYVYMSVLSETFVGVVEEIGASLKKREVGSIFVHCGLHDSHSTLAVGPQSLPLKALHSPPAFLTTHKWAFRLHRPEYILYLVILNPEFPTPLHTLHSIDIYLVHETASILRH